MKSSQKNVLVFFYVGQRAALAAFHPKGVVKIRMVSKADKYGKYVHMIICFCNFQGTHSLSPQVSDASPKLTVFSVCISKYG